MELTIEKPKEHKLPIATQAACLVLLVLDIQEKEMSKYAIKVLDRNAIFKPVLPSIALKAPTAHKTR